MPLSVMWLGRCACVSGSIEPRSKKFIFLAVSVGRGMCQAYASRSEDIDWFYSMKYYLLHMQMSSLYSLHYTGINNFYLLYLNEILPRIWIPVGQRIFVSFSCRKFDELYVLEDNELYFTSVLYVLIFSIASTGSTDEHYESHLREPVSKWNYINNNRLFSVWVHTYYSNESGRTIRITLTHSAPGEKKAHIKWSRTWWCLVY